jgi:mono/diheme cytochrome c family protein
VNGRFAVGALLLVATAGCRQDMHNQPRLEPYETSRFFADGQASRLPPAGTVARGQLRSDDLLYRGLTPAGTATDRLPMPLTAKMLSRGRDQFQAFCSPCHGPAGSGRGMVVRRGYKQPPSFHEERLRTSPVGYFFDVMSNGFATMPSYASQIPVEERWAIAAYIRALQLSQNAHLVELPADVRAAVAAADAKTAAAASPAAAPAAGEGH